MDVRKNTIGAWPTPLEITCLSLALGENEQEELGSKYIQFDSNPIIISLRNRVAMSYHGRSQKILLKNASNLKEALESL